MLQNISAKIRFFYFIPVIIIGVFILAQIVVNEKHIAKKSKATNNENVSVSLHLSKQSVKKDEDITVVVKETPSAEVRIIGYVGTLSFDKSKLKVKDIQYKVGSVSKDLGDENATLSSVNESGKIYLQGEIQSAQGHVLSGQIDLASIVFVALEETTPQLSFTNIKFYRINSDKTLTELLSDNTNINGDVPTEKSITLKIKLQGVLSKPIVSNPISVRIKFSREGGVTPYTVSFTPQTDGTWTGGVNTNIPNGDNYILYVKGPKHIQKKICDSTPIETAAGTYRCSNSIGKISLRSGANTLDLSGIILLAGDIGDSNGDQSGVVDAYDTSMIRQNLQTTDTVTIQLADLNYDGGITTQDWSLLIQSLGIKYDEE